MSPPTKAAGGLDRVLYVRVDADLLAALDALVAYENEGREGTRVSRADMARTLLWNEIQRLKRPRR